MKNKTFDHKSSQASTYTLSHMLHFEAIRQPAPALLHSPSIKYFKNT